MISPQGVAAAKKENYESPKLRAGLLVGRLVKHQHLQFGILLFFPRLDHFLYRVAA